MNNIDNNNDNNINNNINVGDIVPLGDRVNMVYMGTSVSKGKGRAVVVATGNETEMGKIAASLSKATKKTSTPLQKRLDRLGAILCGVAGVCIGVVLLAGWAWGTWSTYPTGLRVAVSIAVAIIPQSIVVVVTLTLTLGVRSMSRQNALVRKLHAVETLGNITNICTDKTGTLTQGKMVATCLALPGVLVGSSSSSSSSFSSNSSSITIPPSSSSSLPSSSSSSSLEGRCISSTTPMMYNISGEGLDPHGAIIDHQGNEILHHDNQQPASSSSMTPPSTTTFIRAVEIAALCNTSQASQRSVICSIFDFYVLETSVFVLLLGHQNQS
eukprot:TRINITY_DN9683_c1_g1_i1.p2 TRINITY_DN9683_c1_g1~~TRINITY_DN9683_c1_g1_i1.p2  ORF type:complete len:358 (-),score=114.29 TRINITY_DN9683_c1_g1_i1:1906-2886(-)